MDTAANPWLINEWTIMLRLLLAIILGGLIGFEREQSNHAAGLRTNILVCLGSCLLMQLSIYGFSDFVDEPNVRVDPARLAAAVITGIGFLGAGTILFTGKSITGLTTAASLWVVSAIGLAVGSGFYFASVSSTLLVLLILWAFNKLEKRYINGKKEQLLKVQADEHSAILNRINQLLTAQQVNIRKMILQEYEENSGSEQIMLHFYLTLPKDKSLIPILDQIKQMEGVHCVSTE
ncbi:MgtC/SapB family protein [Paenibacillus sp. GCM10023252]|uniref:MgtC/SapB family protein n=1 Tax=Paenibacillus sp. GCM10023252 TaxID=3252649 RepID=UPI003613C522